MSIKPDDLKKSLKKIAIKVANHCENGQQNTGFNTNERLACGQFYGEGVENRTQRGLHGSAAAIAILLASQEQDHINIAKKLLLYTKSYRNNNDDINTIKQSEILASFKDNISQTDSSEYASNLKNKIVSAMNQLNGTWSYFIDEEETSEIPTCYALLALHKQVSPNSLSKSKDFLWEHQKSLIEKSKQLDIHAVAIRSLILYVLAKCCDGNTTGATYGLKDLRDTTICLWKDCRLQYELSFELTVEYYHNEKNYYLRLPWQIYLAHATLIMDNSIFYSKIFQKYLATLNLEAKDGGYKYIYSGKYLSTRTNSILYLFFNYASNITPHKNHLMIINDYLNEQWRLKLVRLFVIFILGCLFLYIANENKKFLDEQSSLLNDTLNGLITAFLAYIYGTPKK